MKKILLLALVLCIGISTLFGDIKKSGWVPGKVFADNKEQIDDILDSYIFEPQKVRDDWSKEEIAAHCLRLIMPNVEDFWKEIGKKTPKGVYSVAYYDNIIVVTAIAPNNNIKVDSDYTTYIQVWTMD
jgi:hypothetical protein